MEIVLSIVALAVAALALALVRDARIRGARLVGDVEALKPALDRLRQALDQLEQGDVANTRRELDQLRHELEHAGSEIAELKAAAQAVSLPPPLPRARSGGLDDLRQRLRAAHSEDEPSEDPSLE